VIEREAMPEVAIEFCGGMILHPAAVAIIVVVHRVPRDISDAALTGPAPFVLSSVFCMARMLEIVWDA
jgi:hypothetical protein